MSTDPATIDLLIDSLGRRGASFTTRRMFGEYCLYRDSLPVALVCDDTLFVKDTPAGRNVVAEAGTVEFGPPYPGARRHIQLSPDAWDDGDWLRRVLDVTAAALPPVKPKMPKSPNASRGAKKTGANSASKNTSKATTTPSRTSTAGDAKKPASKRIAATRAAGSATTKRASKKAASKAAAKKTATKKNIGLRVAKTSMSTRKSPRPAQRSD